MGFSGVGSSWDTSEKKMSKGMAGYVAYMDEDNTFLMKMNALEQQSQVKEFWLHTQGHMAINRLEEQIKINSM